MLYVVATPIGNLEDITLRGLRTLKEVDAVVVEDTRVTGLLLKHFDLSKKMIRFYEQIEKKQLPILLEMLKKGENLALVTDAGTPGISDPGFRLVQSAIEAGVRVVPIPGANAAVTALQGSGMPTDHFLFAGFLPEKTGKRRREIERLAAWPHTIILYVSKWKAESQVHDLFAILGDRPVCLARELTKLHEEFWRGRLSDLLRHWEEHPPKGELTLLIGGNGESAGKRGEK